MDNYKCFTNKNCEYFPCHKGNIKVFNCMFCYCPLYKIEECEGNYTLLDNGEKDCSNCTIAHNGESAHNHILDILNKHL